MLLLLAALIAAAPLAAEEPAPAPSPTPPPQEFRLGGELKLHLRHSTDLETPVFYPFGETSTGQAYQGTVDPGTSLEVSTLTLHGSGEVASGVFVNVEVHFLDLYNRNPTSSDDRILLRQAWVRYGDAARPLSAPRREAYVLAGLAPRFTKQVFRRLESYGMWGTAVARFEQPQLQLGLGLGHAYLRAQVGNGNPVFMRDTNALAGDSIALAPGPADPKPVYETGFPILYDAKPADLNLDGQFEWGGGLGVRFARDEKHAIDVLAWHFQRELSDAARIRGTSYLGDLDLLEGAGQPLPFHGRHKSETGVNIEGRAGRLRGWGQLVDQDIAGLGRRGFELELAWVQPLRGLFLIRESPFLNWVQPVVRYSWIDNRFGGVRRYPALSVLWDWKIYDVGVRLGLVRGSDLTIEYARHDAVVRDGLVHPDEFLATLRVGF